MTETLLQKYGGIATVRQIVGNFYSDVLESPNLRRFFVSVDMTRLMEHQTNLFCHLMGGQNVYSGRNMAEAHRQLGISQADFDEVATILRENLVDAGVDHSDVAAILGIVAGYADQIVTK
ncbi:MAG: group I truncated hemoglobin [Silvanigrellaceae bacterium]